MVFDVLELDGKDWRAEPLWKRRRVLEELVAQDTSQAHGRPDVVEGPRRVVGGVSTRGTALCSRLAYHYVIVSIFTIPY
jgi:hypothetical protein